MNFEEKVMRLVRKIPKGKVATYKLIAEKLNSKAYRAVGQALKRNKKPAVIPCHRIVNSDGSIGGYKGRMDNKEKIELLKKEGIDIKGNKIDLRKYLYKF